MRRKIMPKAPRDGSFWQSPKMSFAEYYRQLAKRAVTLLKIKEGMNEITVHDWFPNHDGLWSDPQKGSVLSVISHLFALRAQMRMEKYPKGLGGVVDVYSHGTRNSLERYVPLFDKAAQLKEAGKHSCAVQRMACVYFSGVLFVTLDPEKYGKLYCQVNPLHNEHVQRSLKEGWYRSYKDAIWAPYRALDDW